MTRIFIPEERKEKPGFKDWIKNPVKSFRFKRRSQLLPVSINGATTVLVRGQIINVSDMILDVLQHTHTVDFFVSRDDIDSLCRRNGYVRHEYTNVGTKKI